MADTITATRASLSSPKTSTGLAEVSVPDLKIALQTGRELAFFDVRDEADYATGHILYAVHLPYSRLELLARNLIPRLDTPVVLTDGGEGLAEKAAGILKAAGYENVSLLSGRNQAWLDHGYQFYTGRNVPSIGFFEVIEHERGTPNITAVDLKGRIDRGDDLVVLDTRPREEFEAFHIPGAINAPGAEILHRLGSLNLKPDTLVVANCAGRTRSILGAQSLIDVGVTNPVASLTGGTMEWLIAGYTLEHGPGNAADVPETGQLDGTRELAGALAQKHRVGIIDAKKLEEFRRDTSRNLFLFDVRSPEEYRSGHPQGFRHAAGGQLASGAERFIGVRGARVVLFDPEKVRDRLTASWLVQLGGYEVYVIDGLPPARWQTGPEPRNVVLTNTPAPYVLASTLHAGLRGQPHAVFDLSGSNQYRASHIAGARYVRRAELAEAVAAEKGASILTSEDGALAQIVAAELRAATGKDVRSLLGGNEAWKAAGFTVEKGGLGAEEGGDLPDKYALEPERRNALFREYLNWEVSLVERLTNDQDAKATFRLA